MKYSFQYLNISYIEILLNMFIIGGEKHLSKISDLTFHGAYHYVTQEFSAKHPGTDYGTSRKKLPIYPIEDGTITFVGQDSHGANMVKVFYPRIDKTFIYGHLDRIDVKKNEKVNTNTVLGITGNTGLSTGIHLEIMIYDNKTKKYIDPEKYSLEYNNDNDDTNYYIVQKGDNLTKIAKKYNTTWQYIYNKNKETIGNNPNLIYPGQKLYI